MEKFIVSLKHLKHFSGTTFANLSNISLVRNNKQESHITVRYKTPVSDSGFSCCTAYDVEGFPSKEGYIYDVLNTMEQILHIRINYELQEKQQSYNPEQIDKMDLMIYHPLSEDLPPNYQSVFPVLHSRLALIYKSSSLPIEKDLFIRNITGNVWFYLVGVLILLTICFRLSTFIHHNLRPSHSDWTWMEVVQWTLGAVCQQGSAKHPQGCSCCTMFVIGYMITYMIFTGYAAGITSLLAIRFDSQHLHWDKARDGGGEYPCATSLEELLTEVEQTAKAALVSEACLAHQLSHYISEEMRCKMSFSKQLHHISYTAFAIKKHSQHNFYIYYWLLRLKEHGLLRRMQSRSWPPLPACQMSPGYTEVGFEHVKSAFFIIILHIFGSYIFLILEISFKRKSVSKDKRSSKQKIRRIQNDRLIITRNLHNPRK